MVFFGETVSSNEFEMDIPGEYSLNFLQACLVLDDGDKSAITTLYCKPKNEEEGFILCHLQKKGGPLCYPLSHMFGPEDSPIQLWTVGGKIHLTGKWNWEMDEDDDISDDFSDHESSCEHEDSNKVAGEPEQKEPKASKRKQASTTEVEKAVKESHEEVRTEIVAKKSKKSKKTIESASDEAAEIPPAISVAAAVESRELLNSKANPLRKKWKVKPQDDEGVLVPEPKQLTRPTGISVTDFVIGKGLEPKLGAKVKITYEGFFPDGYVFDSNLKRTKPFVFRKGTGQVIRGLDLGLEGLRIGGSREIVIPPALGYGAEGLDKIPGNQTLVFRVTLVGQVKK